MSESNKTGPKEGTLTLSPQKQNKLKDLFLESGSTPYSASKELKITYRTAKRYFEKYAEEMLQDDTIETWFERESRVRKRALEGYASKMRTIRADIKSYRKILKQKLREKKDHEIERYERIVRNQTMLLIDLTERFDSLEMEPPTEVLLQKEIEMRIAAKNGIEPNYEVTPND
jgi:hypothetical protein